MITVEYLKNWLAEHGYRDQYPRRDASNPDAMLYVFVKDGRRRLGIRTVRGKVKRNYLNGSNKWRCRMNKTNARKIDDFKPSDAMIKRARRHLAGYHFLIEPDPAGGFIGSATELPGVLADGETLDDCARNLSFALETVVASYLADGETPPGPARAEKRTEQVNVRFTPSERALLKRKSASQGFRGIGDMIRAEIIRSVSA